VNLVLFEPADITPDGVVSVQDARATHMIRVLKVVPGETVRIGVIDGTVGIGTVTAVDAGMVTLHCSLGDVPPRPPVDLLLALPRPKVMKRLWAQLVALGVARIMLTNAERVERNYFDTHVIAPECYRPLLIEGLQQARDTRLPAVSIHRQFRKLIEDELATLSDAPVRLVAHPDAAMTIGRAIDRSPGRVLLAVGPEGGWNGFELETLDAHGFHHVSMGTRTLRSDTACVALMAVLHEAIRGKRDL
jgi:RsmE family RNA methyltransferase